jgi:3-deoxy-D-manno-oct-2-ulosonic acid (Kdo) hydroxylase
MTGVETIAIDGWVGPFPEAERSRALAALEAGAVLHFPRLAVDIDAAARDLLSAAMGDGRAKNVSFDRATGMLRGTSAAGAERERLRAMMAAFAAAAARFVGDLFPGYAAAVELGRTSYRPVEIAGRAYSPLKDDTRLHVDAFPSTPTRGRRILRLFANLNPDGEFAARFLPSLGRPRPRIARLLAAVGATRGRRSAYDQLMLRLHNRAKRDAVYQRSAPRRDFAFPAGTSWLCFTDQVLHAALAGQYALEQTFYLPDAAMATPALAPLRQLERMTGRVLV